MIRGDFDIALEKNEKAHARLMEQLGEEHVDIALNMILMGNIYRSMKCEEKAIYYYKKAMAIFEKCGIPGMKNKMEKILESGQIGYIN